MGQQLVSGKLNNIFINGKKETVKNVDHDITLLDWLRYNLKMTGTKEGCNDGNCGACTINIDGSNIQQVTFGLGYDGGAFFSPNGKKLVFRSSRQVGDKEVEENKVSVRTFGSENTTVMNKDDFLSDCLSKQRARS